MPVEPKLRRTIRASFRTCGTLALLLVAAALPGHVTAQAGSPLRLAEVYAIARERNPMLHAVRAAARAMSSREASVRVPPDPELRIGVMNTSLPDLSANMPTSMAPAVEVMQMVPFPGKLSLSGRIASQETARADQAAEEAWWEVRSRVAMAFYDLYEVDRQLDVMAETLGLLEDFRRVAQAMYATGEGRQSDVLRAGVEVARMEAEIARMRAMRTSGEQRLNALLDRPADTPVPPVAFSPLPLVLPPADTLRVWSEATRPALLGARIGVEQAGTRRSLAQREIWPDLTVGVQYGQRPGEMGTERMGSLMLGFTVPIFAGRRQLRMREEAFAMEQMAQAELAEARVQVSARIGELLAELDRARALVRLYRDEVLPQADANVSSAFSGYRVGSVDFMTLLDAQMTLNQYRAELFGLYTEYGQMLAELEMAIGREMPESQEKLKEDT